MATARFGSTRAAPYADPFETLMPSPPAANDVGSVQFGTYDPSLNQTATPPQAPATPMVNNPAGARPQTGLYDPLAPVVSGDKYAPKAGETAAQYAVRMRAEGVSVVSAPQPGETADQFRARNQQESLRAAQNNPANRSTIWTDTAAIAGGVGSVLMNPIGAAIDPYTPDGVSLAVNPVGETLRQVTRAGTNAAVPGNPLGTDYGTPGDIAAGPTPQTQNYVPRTGIGAGGGGAGIGGDAGAAMSQLNAIAANAQPVSLPGLPGYQAPAALPSTPGYVAPVSTGGFSAPVPYNTQGGGAGYVAPGNFGGTSAPVSYQDPTGGGEGYVPFQDTGPFIEDFTENRIGYTGGKFGYTGGRQEDPLLGYIQYTEEEGPSKAEALLTTALERAQANALGQAAMATGGPGAVARARRQAQFSNVAASSRAGAELAALRADEENQRKERLLKGEIAARGRQVEELTAQRGRQSTEEIAARARELSEEEAAQQRYLDEALGIRGQQVEQVIAAGNRRAQGEIAARDRASTEAIQASERNLQNVISERGVRSAEAIASGNRNMTAEVAALDRASTEAIQQAQRDLDNVISTRGVQSAEAIAAADRLSRMETAARDRASAESVARMQEQTRAETAALDRVSNEAIQNQRNQLEAQNAALDRQLKAAEAAGDIANQQLLRDKINQNNIDQLYLQDQLGTPTTEERLYGAVAGLIPVAGSLLTANINANATRDAARIRAGA